MGKVLSAVCMNVGGGGGALADSFHVLVSCNRVGVGDGGGLSFFV